MLLNKIKSNKYPLDMWEVKKKKKKKRNILWQAQLWWIPGRDTLFTVLHLPWQLKCGSCAASAGFSWGSNLRLGHSLSLQWEEVCMWHYKHQAWSQSHDPVLWKASTSGLLTNIDILGVLATPWEGFTGMSGHWEQYMTFPVQLQRRENNCLLMLTSWEMLGWVKHKLESRLPGEISITSDMQMTSPLWQKVKRN